MSLNKIFLDVKGILAVIGPADRQECRVGRCIFPSPDERKSFQLRYVTHQSI